MFFSNKPLQPGWLVVEPTHLKNVLVKLGSSSPKFGVKIPKIFELPPPRHGIHPEFFHIDCRLFIFVVSKGALFFSLQQGPGVESVGLFGNLAEFKMVRPTIYTCEV